MTQSAGNGGHYQVLCSGRILQTLRRLHAQALTEGRGGAMRSALRRLVLRLHHDPTVVGEPLYQLPALRMQVRSTALLPLVIDFAVCEDRPLVFIKGARLMSPQAP
jgi:hypothetical protein